MSSGLADLDDIISRLERLGRLPEETAAKAAPLVEDANRRTAAAGTSPDGVPWAEKKTGGRALVNAAAAVKCSARGSLVTLELAATPTGSVKVQAIQNATRPILPRPGEPIPGPIAGALKRAAVETFQRAAGSR